MLRNHPKANSIPSRRSPGRLSYTWTIFLNAVFRPFRCSKLRILNKKETKSHSHNRVCAREGGETENSPFHMMMPL